MNSMQVFDFKPVAYSVRTVLKNGDVWFVAKDVCDALGLDNNRQALTRLDEDEKGVTKVDTLGGKQEMAIVNESGLYNLIFTSNKPEAKAFRKWVTSEVLPSIRKTGKYEANLQSARLPSIDEHIKQLILERFDWCSECKTRMTMTDICTVLFDDFTKSELNKIKPALCDLGIVIIKPNNKITAFMPRLKG